MKRLTEDAARAGLKKWNRKLALARTKTKRYRRAVRRFDKLAEMDEIIAKATQQGDTKL